MGPGCEIRLEKSLKEEEKKMWDRPEKQEEFSRLRRQKSLKTEELLRAKAESMKIYDGF